MGRLDLIRLNGISSVGSRYNQQMEGLLILGLIILVLVFGSKYLKHVNKP
jgi:hypothetical protein